MVKKIQKWNRQLRPLRLTKKITYKNTNNYISIELN